MNSDRAGFGSKQIKLKERPQKCCGLLSFFAIFGSQEQGRKRREEKRNRSRVDRSMI